jgi:hypothetical protein
MDKNHSTPTAPTLWVLTADYDDPFDADATGCYTLVYATRAEAVESVEEELEHLEDVQVEEEHLQPEDTPDGVHRSTWVVRSTDDEYEQGAWTVYTVQPLVLGQSYGPAR